MYRLAGRSLLLWGFRGPCLKAGCPRVVGGILVSLRSETAVDARDPAACVCRARSFAGGTRGG